MAKLQESVRRTGPVSQVTRPEASPVLNALNIDPASHARMCQEVDAGHVHGTMPCHATATVHCRRSGEDVCDRHESGHAARTGCGQGEHEPIPLLVLSA